ncbi:AT-hook motif nuclear-localized protein 1 [Hibiscus syriacus]|uniref:AT-hook motif nuclear-localized protein n=1 Tax=Hibiscus syriacus TaxID=106335 RepID=A0A6A2ZRJ6_HIBSY|nr:AT-hook motif nuclear-localized protein 1 [Hibiscus syriacus]
MESREAASNTTATDTTTGSTVVGSDAPSDYHIAPNSTQNPGSAPPQIPPQPASQPVPQQVAVAGMQLKKKRGRPRKYGPDGSITMALSPKPISSAAPTPVIDFSAEKRGKANFPTSFSKPKYEIISFSQQGSRAICILSANGVISSVTLRQPDSSGGTLTYEGRFEILSLSGSFMPNDTGGTKSRSGGMSVSFLSPDDRVVGGGVAGLLVATSPVQVVVGSFLAGNQHEQKPKKQKHKSFSVVTPVAAIPVSSADPKSNITTSFCSDSWSPLPSDTRNKPTDTNVSLPGS